MPARLPDSWSSALFRTSQSFPFLRFDEWIQFCSEKDSYHSLWSLHLLNGMKLVLKESLVNWRRLSLNIFAVSFGCRPTKERKIRWMSERRKVTRGEDFKIGVLSPKQWCTPITPLESSELERWHGEVRMISVPFPMLPYLTLYLKCFGEGWIKEGKKDRSYLCGLCMKLGPGSIFTWWNQCEVCISVLCLVKNNLCCRCSERMTLPNFSGHINIVKDAWGRLIEH